MRKLRLLLIKTWLLTALLLCFSVQAINAVTPCTMQHFSNEKLSMAMDDDSVMPCHQNENKPAANEAEDNKQCDNCQCCHVLFSHNHLFSLELSHNLREQDVNQLTKPLFLPATSNSLYRPPISL